MTLSMTNLTGERMSFFLILDASLDAVRSGDAELVRLRRANRVLAMEDDEALPSFLNTMNQQPKSVESQMVLGSLCRRKGEYERASLIHQTILNNASHAPATREQAQFELAQDYQAAGDKLNIFTT